MHVRAIRFVLILLVAPGCRQKMTIGGLKSPDQPQLIVTILRTSSSAADLGKMVADHASSPAVRQLAAGMQREQEQLRVGAVAVAVKKGVAIPNDVEPRKVALKENLSQLSQPQYDSGYVLAVVQDLNEEVAAMERVTSIGDGEVKQWAGSSLEAVRERQKSASLLLNQMGGSPFGIPP